MPVAEVVIEVPGEEIPPEKKKFPLKLAAGGVAVSLFLVLLGLAAKKRGR